MMFDIVDIVVPVEVGRSESESFVVVLIVRIVLFVRFEELELQPSRLVQPENTPVEQDI